MLEVVVERKIKVGGRFGIHPSDGFAGIIVGDIEVKEISTYGEISEERKENTQDLNREFNQIIDSDMSLFEDDIIWVHYAYIKGIGEYNGEYDEIELWMPLVHFAEHITVR